MSVATTTSKIQYTLTTGSQALSIPFYFLDNAHIKAVTVATETVASITLVLGTDYTLTGALNPAGGTLTTIATIANGLAAGSKVVIKRNVPITQPTSYSPNDAFPAKVHESALDRGVMIEQQIDEQADRAIRFPEDDSRDSVLPSAVLRAGKALAFDLDGDVEVVERSQALFTSGDAINVPTIAALRAYSYTSVADKFPVNVGGYYATGDGGGGQFYVDKADTTTADDGINVIVAADGTRIKRLDQSVKKITFGVPGTGISLDSGDVHNGPNFFGSTDNNMMSWKNTGTGASAIRYLDINGIELGAFGYGSHNGTPRHPFCDMMYVSIGGGSAIANGGHPTSFAIVNDNTGMNTYVALLVSEVGTFEYRRPDTELVFSIDLDGNTNTWVGTHSAKGLISSGGVNFYATGYSTTPAIFTNASNQIGFGTNNPSSFAHFQRDNAVVTIESTAAGDTGLNFKGVAGLSWWLEMGRADIFGDAGFLGFYNSASGAVITMDGGTGNVTFLSAIKTGAPSGGTAVPVRFGSYVGGAPTATGYQQIEINGTAYKVLVAT